jgi:hypothetical protein
MMTVEIKVNDRVVECVTIQQIRFNDLPHQWVEQAQRDKLEYDKPDGFRTYAVNGVYMIQHRRGDGHRELARKALEEIKKFKE